MPSLGSSEARLQLVQHGQRCGAAVPGPAKALCSLPVGGSSAAVDVCGTGDEPLGRRHVCPPHRRLPRPQCRTLQQHCGEDGRGVRAEGCASCLLKQCRLLHRHSSSSHRGPGSRGITPGLCRLRQSGRRAQQRVEGVRPGLGEVADTGGARGHGRQARLLHRRCETLFWCWWPAIHGGCPSSFQALRQTSNDLVAAPTYVGKVHCQPVEHGGDEHLRYIPRTQVGKAQGGPGRRREGRAAPQCLLVDSEHLCVNLRDGVAVAQCDPSDKGSSAPADSAASNSLPQPIAGTATRAQGRREAQEQRRRQTLVQVGLCCLRRERHGVECA
mmetsp:Transcript_68911/g.213764  ORF Transcript_68911/g.213764 Transcript_68911/m.213764 type:complete len:328 (-) Transcript_68911:538-1521(-)